MKSLRKLVFDEVIKIGTWRLTRLPPTLSRELQAVEELIEQNMTGNGYYDFNKLESPRFSIDWSNGDWFFYLHGGPWKKELTLRVILDYNRKKYMSNDWSDVFGLSCTESRVHGFWVNGYDLQVNSKKVNFYGFHIDDHVRTVKFRAEFTFDPDENCLDVHTFGWFANQMTYLF